MKCLVNLLNYRLNYLVKLEIEKSIRYNSIIFNHLNFIMEVAFMSITAKEIAKQLNLS